jgi:hypothetical protein
LDIQRLRRAGYTFSAIRLALLEAGISVSLTTIKREAARQDIVAARPSASLVMQHLPPSAAPDAVSPPALPGNPVMAPGTSSRDIAAAFFNANPSNLLLRKKDPS